MSTLPPPLLRRRSLLPGESLTSLLLRLTKANHYDSRFIVIGLVLAQKGEEEYYTNIARALSLPMLERLTALTKLDYLALYSSTYHRFAPTIMPPDITVGSLKLANHVSLPLFTGRVAQFQLRPEFAIQFCPECLRSSSYHRLMWTPVAVAACLDHQSLLINRCPQCSKPIKIRDVIETYCSRCKSSLMEAQSIEVQGDQFGLFSQRVIQSWFEGEDASRSGMFSLAKQPARVLYRFIDGLRMTLMKVQPDWRYFHSLQIKMQAMASMTEMKPQALTPYQSYCLYATAMKAVINWPQGFYDFLDAYRGYLSRKKPIGHAVGYDLGSIYTWLQLYWQHPAFAFVQEAFNHYFVEKYDLTHEVMKTGRYRNNQELVKRFAYISVKEAADLLHTDNEMIKFLVQTGRLTKYESQDAYKYLRLNRSEVLAFQARWLDSLSLGGAASLMGAPTEVIPGLVKIGLLGTELSPLEGARYWRINNSGVVNLMNTLAERCLDIDEKTSTAIDLTTASRLYVARSGLDSAHLLLQVTKGLIRVYHKKNQPIQIRSLLFDRSDIDENLTQLYAEKGWVDKSVAIKLLRTGPKTLSRWVNTGLLKMVKYKNICVFEKKTIEEFLANHVRSKAAAEILGVDEKDVNVLAHMAVLKAVSGPSIDGYSYHIFSKETLFQWKSIWLTYKEAAKLLEVEDSMLFDFAKEGRIVTLKPRYGAKLLDGVRTWYSRPSILELRETLRSEKA